PAAAAWSTSGQGSAGAKAGVLANVSGIACSAAGVISWTAVAGATEYDVWWSANNGNFTGPIRVKSGTSYATGNAGVKRTQVQALAGTTWSSAVVPRNCP
ncbi:hypothetical protein, partial [Lentzea sp. NPDC060358]|uniref:hypothetical protein n=1 Tax=Lentzea sp. NPDC060358 TaxID=3347103 RepID=UPI0036474097